MMNFINRVAVISGATGGLGSVVTHELARQAANLALLDRSLKNIATLTESLSLPTGRILAQQVDLLDPAQTKSAADAVVAKFGRADILLHLVGGWTGGKTILDAPSEDLVFMLNQHVWTSFNITRAFVPHLVRNGWGRVIMITSPYADHPTSKGGPYAIGKSGQEALMRVLSQELIGTGVTANLLEVKTIDIKEEKISHPSAENVSWTTPEELTSAILYLLSNEAGTVNGAKIPLYGSK
jgi:NAD(P)-dependent dehydrogenase (short-subunit alcohol dehydrogenase family)